MRDSLFHSNATVEVLAPILPDEPRSSSPSTTGRGHQVNKFLLCTLVCGMAREIKARAAQSGQTVPLLKIVRDVLRFHLEEVSVEKGLSSEGRLLNEEALRSEIERRLQEYLKQSQEHRAEAKRLDLESVITAVAARHNRGIIKRGLLPNVSEVTKQSGTVPVSTIKEENDYGNQIICRRLIA